MAPTTMTCATGQSLLNGSWINLPAGSPCRIGVADGTGGCVAPSTGIRPAGQTMKNGVWVIGSSTMDDSRTTGSTEVELRPLQVVGTAAG